MNTVSSLMPQQIPVGTGIVKPLVALSAPFTQG